MAALSPLLRSVEGGCVAFWCPGCDESRVIAIGEGPGPRWGYNGNPNAPTFTPSIHVTTGRAVNPAYQSEPDDPPEVCHSFVREGRIEFCGDSTHALAGQTVDLPPWES